ncbi:hypothetical protein ABXS75_18480 [Roseburia hominis]
MKIQDGPIIPGVRIGNIRLGIDKEELLRAAGEDYQEEFLEMGSIIKVENARFWIASDGKVDQIGVEGDFEGKYKGVIGLGSTLKDVKGLVGNYVEVYDTYEMEVDKGICFELEDVDEWEEWDELRAPIDHIYVFRV